MINFEGGAIAEEYQVEYVIDRVEATSTAFMGLTMGCARCHSHKYDPITHKEFYQFFAFFNTVPEQGLDGRTRQRRAVHAAADRPSSRRSSTSSNAAIEAREDGARRRRRRAAAGASGRSVCREQRRRASTATGWSRTTSSTATSPTSPAAISTAASIAGDPTFDAGQVGRAVSFDGDTEVSFGNVGAFDRDEPFSLAVWLKGARQPADGGVPEARRRRSAGAATNGRSTTSRWSAFSGGRRG